MGWKHVVFGGGSSESDWTLLRRPSPRRACAREVTGIDRGFVHVFETSKDRNGKLERFCDRAHIQPHSFRLQLPQARPAPHAPPARLARTRTRPRRTRAVKERQSRHRWSLENTREDGPRPSPTVSPTVPGDTRENVASLAFNLSVFHPHRTGPRRTARSARPRVHSVHVS